MRERPAGGELIDLARHVLRQELLAALPEGRRYQALMVLNALGIAARQIEAGDGPEKRERESLAGILGKAGGLAELNRELARTIRAGRFDPGKPGAAAAWRHLRETTLAAVRESNPKALAGRE